jgi:hypothetical protein
MRTLLVLLGALAAAPSALPAQGPASSRPEAPASAAPLDGDAALLRQASVARDALGRRAPTAVRFDRPTAGGPLWALGEAWKASFDAEGSTVIPFFGSQAPQNFPLRVELQGATVGGEPLALADGAPVQVGQAVHTDRGALTEVIDTYVYRLEQSFVFAQLPHRGAIAVDVALAGDYATAPIEGGLRFANAWGHVDYTKAVAVDAKGERLPLAITWDGDSAHIEIPAAFVERAALPIVLDPVLNYWFLLASGNTLLQHDADVASFQALGGRTLLVWQRQWSLTDQDVWGLMFDGGLGLVATDFSIDFTTDDWLKVSVAGHNHSQTFMLVGEVRIGLLWFIAGRPIAANASLGSVFPIEREGVVGIPGNNHHPDVGSDPYFGPGRYTIVFQKRTLTTALIYMRQVTPAGGLVTTNPIGIETDTSTQKNRPSISKSCGQANGVQQYLLTWQRQWPGSPFDGDAWGCYVGWNGTINLAAFAIAFTTAEETAVVAGSPIDVDGQRMWPVAYELAGAAGQPRDVMLRTLRGDATTAGVTMVNTPVPGEDDNDPELDSDGTRMVVTRTLRTGPGSQVEAVTLAFMPATNAWRVEERTGLVTSSPDTYEQTNVCADFSGGNAVTPRYLICFSERTSNTFRLAAFAGHNGGSPNLTPRFTQCGATTISGSGQSIIGQTVTISASGPGYTGMLFGFPGSNLFGPCGCLIGVDNAITMPNPLVWSVPNHPAYVGIQLSAQAFSLSGSVCFGTVDLSNTLDFTIR